MLIAPALSFVLAAALQGSAEIPIPTTIERGLVDRACKDSVDQADVNEKCREEKLVSLRTDFGKDLGKVKADDRKKVDATCTPLLADSALKGKEPYFECMLAQLTALKTKGRKPANAAAPTDAGGAPTDAPAAGSVPAPPPAASGTSRSTLIAGAVGVLALGGGLAFVVLRSRGPKTKKCQSCGADTPADAVSEFCDNCRKTMADVAR